ncbi:MAG: 2-oxoacid:acceptor oxidoreductase subunit alpha [Microgenomates group bacterium]|nr:2-oxoacid:acceptor oxidoreductase subunit alpha [Microgenomates group bacterium]
MTFTWKIGGEAGFGIMTTGLVFSKIASRLGYKIFDFIEYPSLIRGGHNAYEVRISDEDVKAPAPFIDCLVCLNLDTLKKHQKRLQTSSLVIYDEEDFQAEGNFQKISVPYNKIIKKNQGPTVMKNTIALGASLALLGGDFEILEKIIEEQFKNKGEKIIDFNKKFAFDGYQHIIKNYPNQIKPILKKIKKEDQLVLSGNDAFSLASVIADCRMYVAYPMTPASSVLATLASWQEKTGMIVRHAEDEISVINTAIGSSFAGARSAVGTSGGGFALMVEAIALAGITETPLVIFLSQRPGPATGMPTWTEQGDLLFAINAGHGEFPKIVLAPGDAEEMIELTAKAYNLADIYQTPVIIMSDMHLSESHFSVSLDFINKFIANYSVDRGKTIKLEDLKNSNLPKKFYNLNQNSQFQNFLRYQITEDGISLRLLPGEEGYYYQANSYEHLENGHTTEEGDQRREQVNKRNRKIITYLKNHFQIPKVYGDLAKAEIIFVSWGSTKGAVIEAQKILAKSSKSTAFIHFNHLYPLAKEKINHLFLTNKKYVLVENNSWGQLGKLLMQEIGIEIKEKILKYDGRQITPEEIINSL